MKPQRPVEGRSSGELRRLCRWNENVNIVALGHLDEITFYPFLWHHPLITQLNKINTVGICALFSIFIIKYIWTRNQKWLFTTEFCIFWHNSKTFWSTSKNLDKSKKKGFGAIQGWGDKPNYFLPLCIVLGMKSSRDIRENLDSPPVFITINSWGIEFKYPFLM